MRDFRELRQCDVRRIPLPGPLVNKALSDALGSLGWHHSYGWHGGALTERHCRNCGHELAETDRFCPNCGTPVHEAAHVSTPEADVDVPSPPKQAGVTTPPPDEAGREGAQRGVLVAPRPRWAQIGVAVLLAGMITTIPQLIWWLATGLGVFPSPQFVFGILHPLTLLCGLWAGLAWPGRHPKGYALLGSFAGLLDLVINWSIAVILRNWWPDVWYITPLDFLSDIGIAALFTAGGLFGDLIESWRLPRRREEESEVVREIAQQASGPRRQPSETTLKLVQALGPSLLALLGLIIAVITQRY
jgi:zinc ribbon protein